MKEPLVSVVVPFYNAGPFLAHAVESVLKSTLGEIELVLVDDGGGDESAATAHEYERNDERVRIVKQDHQGLVAALNNGIGRAQSRIIARMDADDVCHPDRFLAQYAFLMAHPEISLVSCLVEPVSDRPLTEGTRRYVEWLNKSITPQQIARDLYVESPLPHPSVMFRKDTVQSLGAYRDYDGPEDYDLWLRMTSAEHLFAKVPRHLLKWRFHDGNLTRSDPRYRKKAFLARKLEFIAERILSDKLASGRSIRIYGTGQAGRRLHGILKRNGIAVEAFVGDDPSRKSSLCIASLPAAIGFDDSHCFYFCAVQRWTRWDEIRRAFADAGKVEGADFVLV